MLPGDDTCLITCKECGKRLPSYFFKCARNTKLCKDCFRKRRRGKFITPADRKSEINKRYVEKQRAFNTMQNVDCLIEKIEKKLQDM